MAAARALGGSLGAPAPHCLSAASGGQAPSRGGAGGPGTRRRARLNPPIRLLLLPMGGSGSGPEPTGEPTAAPNRAPPALGTPSLPRSPRNTCLHAAPGGPRSGWGWAATLAAQSRGCPPGASPS
ncbi:proline-rich proteoglycan 2-like [Sapajus apella]|uniref:Proline-rich proteoglycan 2-like n=1 Tax=Sapajus apella TaxID=9515 RepID=A0A6J3HMX5_SAPAP|nr:proline-rich proteoglycan 2-like [Sapajus apella]